MKKLDSRFRGNDTGNLVDSSQTKTALVRDDRFFGDERPHVTVVWNRRNGAHYGQWAGNVRFPHRE
jgi:hypothetical protein